MVTRLWQDEWLCGDQGQASLLPAVDAVTVPVEIAVTQGVGALDRVPAQPAVGAAVEHQRPAFVAMAGLLQVLTEVVLPLAAQLPRGRIWPPPGGRAGCGGLL